MLIKVSSLSALLVLAAQTPLYAENKKDLEDNFPVGTYIGVSIGAAGNQGGNINQTAKGPGSYDEVNKSYWRQSSLDALNSALDSTNGQYEVKAKLSIGRIFRSNDFIISPELSISRGFNSEISTSTGDIAYPCCAGTVKISQTIKPKFNIDGTIRIGYSLNKFMPYLAGGPSLSIANVTNTFSDTFGLSAEKKNNGFASWGYIVGGGIEYALNDKTSLKLEYTYSKYSLPRSSASGTYNNIDFTADKATYSGDYHQGTLWLGANYRL